MIDLIIGKLLELLTIIGFVIFVIISIVLVMFIRNVVFTEFGI